MSKMKLLTLFTLLALCVSTVLAQEACPPYVQEALETVTDLCADLGRDEACYGNAQIDAELRDDSMTFAAPGDMGDVAQIESLRLTGLDIENDVWGIALLTVQANISDLLPQNVTIVLFGDVSITNGVAEGDDTYGPMQAFYVETGANDRPCTEAPDSGIMIQTPAGVGEINFLVDEVDIRLGSTAFIQQNGGTMIFCVLEGEGSVTLNGVTREIPEGGYTTIEIDDDLRAVGRPSPAAGYDEEGLATLPLDLLPRAIVIAPGWTTAETETETAQDEVTPDEGLWEVTGIPGICEYLNGTRSSTSLMIFGTGTLTVDGNEFTFEGPNGTTTHVRTSPNSYFLSMETPDNPNTVDSYFTTGNSPTSMTTILNNASATRSCTPTDGSATWEWIQEE